MAPSGLAVLGEAVGAGVSDASRSSACSLTVCVGVGASLAGLGWGSSLSEMMGAFEFGLTQRARSRREIPTAQDMEARMRRASGKAAAASRLERFGTALTSAAPASL